MPVITLPDGPGRQFDNPVTVQQVAADIGSGLAKATLAGVVNDQLVDASHLIEADASLAIVTDKSDEALEIIRHSTAHLLAQAVKLLFPEAQVTIGPVIEDGFFYDFAYERAFTTDDLKKIEKAMAKPVSQNLPLERSEMPREEAIDFFNNMGEAYKAELVEAIPHGEVLSLYKQGDFTDLCRGPHVPSTSKLKAFKLMTVAGAYWRCDDNRPQLQRIYGTAFDSPEQLSGPKLCI